LKKGHPLGLKRHDIKFSCFTSFGRGSERKQRDRIPVEGTYSVLSEMSKPRGPLVVRDHTRLHSGVAQLFLYKFWRASKAVTGARKPAITSPHGRCRARHGSPTRSSIGTALTFSPRTILKNASPQENPAELSGQRKNPIDHCTNSPSTVLGILKSRRLLR
jgi:hypothetical protein